MISFSTVLLDGMNLEAGLRQMAKAGSLWVEPVFIEGYMAFDETDFVAAKGRALAALIADCGLSVRAMSAHTDLGLDTSADSLLRRLEFAQGLGARILISNATTVQRRAMLDTTLARCLPEFHAAGMVLALENPGHGRDALIPDGAAGAALLAQFEDAALRLNYDIGNALTYGARSLGLLGDLRAALPWTAHLHLKDVQVVGEDWTFCAIGAGSVGYDTAVASLVPLGMAMGVEVPLRLWRPGRGDPVRRSAPVLPQAVVRTVSESLAALAALGLSNRA